MGGGGYRVATGERRESPEVGYVFSGRLTLYPIFSILLLLSGALLFSIGSEDNIEWKGTTFEIITGLVGLLFMLTALVQFTLISLFTVFKLSFVFSPQTLEVTKHGIFRSHRLYFQMKDVSLHYYRSHFREEKAWLQLVVRERNRYHQISSWKAQGAQRDRFMELFARLQCAYERHRGEGHEGRGVRSVEIIGKDEIALITPFSKRLNRLAYRPKGIANARGVSEVQLCIEDVVVVNHDRFFFHFKMPNPLQWC